MARVNKKKQRHGSPIRGPKNAGSSQRAKHQKSSPALQQMARESSEQEPASDNGDRKRNDKPQKPIRGFHSHERSFNILVDNVPYTVEASPFIFNGEIRYKVIFNGSPEHLFTWDSELGQLRAVDDDSSTMPDNLETAISKKLQSKA